MATEFEQKYNSEAYLEPKPLTIFAKNATSQIFDSVLPTPLPLIDVRKNNHQIIFGEFSF